MVQRRQRERSLFEVLLPDGHKLWPDWLRKIDTLLEDEAVLDVVAHALEARWPQSRRRGRLGTPAEVAMRMLILKHLFDWSYDDLEREVRANLVYRMFTRIDAGEVPDAKTILKIARALGPDVIEQLHGRWSRSRSVPGSRTVADFASTPRSWKRMCTIRRTVPCCKTGCACSRARCTARVPRWATRPRGFAIGCGV